MPRHKIVEGEPTVRCGPFNFNLKLANWLRKKATTKRSQSQLVREGLELIKKREG